MITTSPILITGIPRSRTSLVGGIINLCGAWGGNMSGANKNNKKGMFENSEVRGIIKNYLKSQGLDVKSQYPIPEDLSKLENTDIGEQIKNVMIKQGYPGGSWFYKGCKMCLIWPVMNNAFPGAKWIIVRRKREGIVDSCTRTSFMNAFRKQANRRAVGARSEVEGWHWWVTQHEKRFREMIEAGLQVRVVWTDRLPQGDFSEMAEVVEWAGLTWTTEAEKFVEPSITKK